VALLADVRERATPALVAWGMVAVYVLAFCYAMQRYDYDIWGGFLVAPVLVALTVPVLIRLGRRDPDPRIVQLLVAAFLLKMVATLARYWMVFGLYGGAGDSARYGVDGSLVADQLRQGIIGVHIGAPLVGTGFVIVVTGLVFAVTGPTLVGGFLVFGWLSFWGQYFFYRAFRVGYAKGDHWRYALLVFLLPSILFWPSSMGKDAWMLFCLGITAYGAAKLFERQRGAVVWLVLGSAGTAFVRPHVTVLVYAGILAGYLLRKRPAKLSALGPVKSVLAVGALAVVGMMVIRQASAFLGTDSFSVDAVDQKLTDTQARTSGAGSDYSTPGTTSPLRLPMSVVTVLFRPFPFEAHNIGSLIASAEGMLLLGLCVVSFARIRVALRSMRRHPYICFALVYTLLFCFAFASFANFGILTRERVQVFPFVLVLLAAPLTHRPPQSPGPTGVPASLSGRSTAP
jgi:hypothetical protein